MIFYKYIFFKSLIFIIFTETATEKNPDLHFDTGFEAPTPSQIGLIFCIKINNTSENNYDIELKADECCLEDGDSVNCDFLQILDECKDSIANGSLKTLKIVAPLLDLYERKGHCTLYADSKSDKSDIKRNILTLNFNTKSDSSRFNLPRNYKVCKSRDEDPLNDCQPVNCYTYYNGRKNYYSRREKRCLEVPSCVYEDDSDTPDVIYDPITNRCTSESLIGEDLRYVKSLSKTIGKTRKTQEVLIIRKFRPNATDLDGVDMVNDLVKTTRKHSKLPITPSPRLKQHTLRHTAHTICQNASSKYPVISDARLENFKRYLVNNKWTFVVLGIVLSVQCFLIYTIFYCLSKTCKCSNNKKVVRKFFNYNQDASVTTPLIGTSNIDTETENQYVSDSTKIDQKIKCYKACQKELTNDMKVSMSDDILSKCLNRRDWKKLSKSEAATKEGEIAQNILDEIKDTHKPIPEDSRKSCETRVVFEDEIIKSSEQKVVNIECSIKAVNDEKEVEGHPSSEKEIKCHSYNCYGVNLTGFQPNRTAEGFKTEQSAKGTVSVSTEKGAQAYFSNDSIDDFLSDRGVIYLAGEHLSKYTFSSDSNEMKRSNVSSVSSKTSKNFVKNVLSLLRKRSKQGPSSDPGRNKEVDLELIHMSRASVYTSSNDSDCVKTFKRKDSRTSF